MSYVLNTEVLNKLSEQFGDAFYLLDSDRFEENYRQLKNSFGAYCKNFNIAYSYKTNYTPKLAAIVNKLGGYAEIVSDMELDIALKCGVDAKRIIWNGPVKNAKRVEEFLLSGGTVNVDSVSEIKQISKMAGNHRDSIFSVGIRCNYDVGDGVLSRFGIDVSGDDFDEALRIISSSDNIVLSGLQAHFAKRSPEYWQARTKGMLDLYDRVLEYGIHPARLDIGGGIYGKMPDFLRSQIGVGKVEYEDYSIRSAKLFAERFSGIEDAPELIIEPGTAIAGDCMRFVCRVKTVKTVRGKTVVTVMGSQKNISMSGINPPLEVIPCGDSQTAYENADIVGFTCIEGDVLYKNFSGKLAVGDYAVIGNCGSYSLVMKPPFILPNFPVLDISSGDVEVIKRAEVFEDLFCTYNF